MDWEDYRYILELDRAGTLSAAASRVGVARSTVGRRLRAMESDLGVRLFDQTPQGFVATNAGEILLEVARDLERTILAGQARVAGLDETLRGPLHVSTADMVYRGFLGVFASFMERHPGIELTVSTTFDAVSLRHREADVVLRMSGAPPEHLVGRKLCPMEFGVYASPALFERVGRELQALPWLQMNNVEEDGGFSSWLAERAPNPKIVLRFSGYEVLRASMHAGLGAYFLPRIDGDADPRLERLECDLPQHPLWLWALTLPELRTNVRVRAFLDYIYQELHVREG